MDGYGCNNWLKGGLEKVTGSAVEPETANLKLAAFMLHLRNKINVMMQPHFWHPS